MTAAPRRTGRAAGRRRSSARLAAAQALFQLRQGGQSVDEIVEQFLTVRILDRGEAGMPGDADREFFEELVDGAAVNAAEIDALLTGAVPAGWSLERMDPVLRAILSAAVFELKWRPDVPARVAIDEYVEVAHAFFGEREPKFVNGALDRLARSLRPAEFEAGPPA